MNDKELIARFEKSKTDTECLLSDLESSEIISTAKKDIISALKRTIKSNIRFINYIENGYKYQDELALNSRDDNV